MTQTTAEEIKEATQQARELLKDLKRERKEIETFVERVYSGLVVEWERRLSVEFEEMSKDLGSKQQGFYDAIERNFDTLANIFLTGSADGSGEPLNDIAERGGVVAICDRCDRRQRIVTTIQHGPTIDGRAARWTELVCAVCTTIEARRETT